MLSTLSSSSSIQHKHNPPIPLLIGRKDRKETNLNITTSSDECCSAASELVRVLLLLLLGREEGSYSRFTSFRMRFDGERARGNIEGLGVKGSDERRIRASPCVLISAMRVAMVGCFPYPQENVYFMLFQPLLPFTLQSVGKKGSDFPQLIHTSSSPLCEKKGI